MALVTSGSGALLSYTLNPQFADSKAALLRAMVLTAAGCRGGSLLADGSGTFAAVWPSCPLRRPVCSRAGLGDGGARSDLAVSAAGTDDRIGECAAALVLSGVGAGGCAATAWPS